MEEEEESCPYCKSNEDCKHLVAVTDPFDYEHFSIGGSLYDAEQEIYKLICESMNRHKTEFPKSIIGNNQHRLKGFWRDWLNETELSAENFLAETSSSELYEYLSKLLFKLNIHSSYDAELSGWTFYDEDSEKAWKKFFQELKEDLK